MRQIVGLWNNLGLSHAERRKDNGGSHEGGIEQERPPAHGAQRGQKGLAHNEGDQEVDRCREALPNATRLQRLNLRGYQPSQWAP